MSGAGNGLGARPSDRDRQPDGSDGTLAAGERLETRDWLDVLDALSRSGGPARVERLMGNLLRRAALHGAVLPAAGKTPYLNTIPLAEQPTYPGDGAIEWRIRAPRRK